MNHTLAETHSSCQWPRNLGHFTAIVFDLGDVLFTCSPRPSESPLPEKTLGNILRSTHWYEYEKGNLTEDQAYSAVAEYFDVAVADVKGAIEVARDSLQSNPRLMELIHALKQSGLAIYAMSNISGPDWEVLSTKANPQEWALFDRVFTSAAAHERKPNIGFYKHILENSGIDPFRAIFVDDKIENVLTARSFGMHGIIFDDQEKAIQQLKNLCGDPVARGQSFLASRKKCLKSVTSNNVELAENFSQLLILEVTRDSSLVEYIKHAGQFNFFENGGVLTSECYPNDLDTTSIGLTVSDHVDEATKHKVMDQMLEYQNSDGVMQVYFDHERPRIDPIVCINVLNLFYKNGRGHELPGTLNWVEEVLKNRAYISGTYYYASADHFLFFLARLMQTAPEVHQRIASVFRDRVAERLGVAADALSLAARIIAACVADLVDQRDVTALLSLQNADGAWRDGWFYRYGASGIFIKNDGITTALAVRAIQDAGAFRTSQAECAATHCKASPTRISVVHEG